MAFIDTRLHEKVAAGFVGGPEWQTLVVPLVNGHEQRNAQWMYPKHRYSAQFNNISASLRNSILEAFHACRGQLHAFRFKDWNDYTGTGEEFLEINGVWRMVKQYTFGSETSTRLIQAPIDGEISLSGGSLANLDYETGIYDGDASGLTWSGEFDVWVRFASDYNAFRADHLLAHTADIELIEVRR